MPSVGMRRATRVFGVLKSTEGARVLRSGRRLWPESGDVKLRKGNDGDDVYKRLVKTNSGKAVDDSLGFKKIVPGLSPGIVKTNQKINVVDVDGEFELQFLGSKKEDVNMQDLNRPDSMFRNVYTRKRKRLGGDNYAGTNKMFRIQFARRQRKKVGESDDEIDGLRLHHIKPVLSVVVESSCGRNTWFPRFLLSVFRYSRNFLLSCTELSAFVLSEPIKSAYASTGIHFLKDQDHLVAASVGVCEFFVSTEYMPVFSVNFSAIPHCFNHMHSRILLRSMQSFVNVNNFIDGDDDFEIENDVLEICSEQFFPLPSKRDPSQCGMLLHNESNVNSSMSFRPCVKGSKLAGRNSQYRNVLNARGIQRRRSSLRRRRKASPSLVGIHKANGLLISDSRINKAPSAPSGRMLRSSVLGPSPNNLKKVSASVVGSAGRIGQSFCSANILVVEEDKCYRILGGVVMVDFSASEKWVLAVKKDGITRYTFKTEKVMRPSSFNRYTHVVMWSMDNGWKLEFPNRQDWLAFKELYKECSDRNVAPSNVKFIPIPGVREVVGYGDTADFSYCRPDTYIRMNNDELSRAMTARTPIYDMDSEDEQWLNKFNNELQECVSEDNFELMIGAFEKALFCNPDDFSYEKAASYLCIDFGTREAVEGVFNHWMKRRKQKRFSLLRVFQGYRSKKAPVVPKQPILRKKRSFKRQPSQAGRGKQPNILQAIAAEQETMEERNAILKVEEAKAAVSRCTELAIQKRQRAQRLMENADLATYKATMLLRIAEAARVAESTEASAGSFLD